MRKILVLILSLFVALNLIACGDTENNEDNEVVENEVENNNGVENKPEPEAEMRKKL